MIGIHDGSACSVARSVAGGAARAFLLLGAPKGFPIGRETGETGRETGQCRGYVYETTDGEAGVREILSLSLYIYISLSLTLSLSHLHSLSYSKTRVYGLAGREPPPSYMHMDKANGHNNERPDCTHIYIYI